MGKEVTRRELFKTVIGVAGILLFSACDRFTSPLSTPIRLEPSPESYPLTEENGTLVDKKHASTKRPFLESIRFSFDPDRSQGSLVMDTTIRQDSEFRIMTEETDVLLSTNPGFIYCLSTLEKAGLVKKYPVIRFAPLEEYLISLGFKLPGESCSKTYQDMLTYYITRDNNGKLQGRFEGLKTFNPDDSGFQPRDAEAATYFQKGCLS